MPCCVGGDGGAFLKLPAGSGLQNSQAKLTGVS